MCMYVCVCVYETNIIFRGFNFISTGDEKTKKKKKKCQSTSGFIVNFKRQRMKHDFCERDYTLNLLAYFNVNPNC